MANIKLKEYADIKDSSIEDVIKYASGKGINIPDDPNFVLDDSILKEIDPVFQCNMKYNKVVSKKRNVHDHIDLDSSNQFTHPMRNDIFTISGNDVMDDESFGKTCTEEVEKSTSGNKTDRTDQITEPIQQSDKKSKKNKKLVIGIVKFFDWNKNFGFVVTENKGVSRECREIVGTLFYTNKIQPKIYW